MAKANRQSGGEGELKDGVVNQGFEIDLQDVNMAYQEEPASSEKTSGKRFGLQKIKTGNPLNATENYINAHSKTFKYIGLGILGAGFVAFFVAACVMNFERSIGLVVLTCLAVASKAYDLLKKYKGDSFQRCLAPTVSLFQKNLRWIKWVFIASAVVLLIVWLALDTSQRPEQLISFAGICMFVLLSYIFSANRPAVSWRPVLWGLGMQFCIGLFVIRSEPGLIAFQWLGDQVQIFLNYTKAGSSFVFGELISDIFAFQALPIVVFFSSVVSVLYYLGLMQWLIVKISWVMQLTLGTSATETLSVAGNIFIGQTEAPLLIRPYLKDMTESEIHAVMTGGFATIAGSVMGAFISFGIDASSLISASVMAAPCALAISKLSYPETKKVQKSDEDIVLLSGEERNVLEAASNGASASIGLVANIVVNLISFLAILEFINAILRWLGGMVGYPYVSFQLICSYLFMPFAFMMGIPYEESFTVAELLGTKLFLNEFLAYEKLSEMKTNRVEGLDEVIDGVRQWISVRSEIISTYALCGFANISSIGMVMGGLASICPAKKQVIAALVVRALFAGTCASFINACVAGVLFVPPLDCLSIFRTSVFNGTEGNIQTCCSDLYASTVNNGNITFIGSWTAVTNATQYFTQCCGIYEAQICK
ncbi:sodium/nucleoside cotransporter 1 [Gadus chalcogrammus]|uniref:sodium/nucleoside cotransporter 1 n=1 Tax=Gadus chalcogrammus TaxID=1042646 RepID=UPI0024C495AF|nr:sodium/nucleoside cotransporter 1 [Gadus chalcogrammus]